MSNQIALSDLERKRPNITSESLLNVKTNVTVNSSSAIERTDDEIDNKRSKTTPTENTLIASVPDSERMNKEPQSPHLSLSSLIHRFDTFPPSLLPFSTDLINEEFITQLQQIISFWNTRPSQRAESNPQSSCLPSSELLDCCDSYVYHP